MAYSTPANPIVSRIAEVYENQVAITPADNTPVGPFMALWVGEGGNIALCPRNSTTIVNYLNVPSVTLLRAPFQGINATNTSATGLIGLG
jgi:hypothetical protein